MSISNTREPTSADYLTREYVVYEGTLGRDQMKPVHFTIPEFNSVDASYITVILGATRQDIPLLGWKVENIIVNGRSFVANDPVNPTIILDNAPNGVSVLKAQDDNIVEIKHTPPLLAGTPFTGDIPITIRLWVHGLKANWQDAGLGVVNSLTAGAKNLQTTFLDTIKTNTPLAIALLAVFAVIIVGIAYILFQTQGERSIASGAITSASAQAKSAGATAQKVINSVK